MWNSTWPKSSQDGEHIVVQEPQVLDACVLINLLASGEIEAVLTTGARRSLVCSVVRAESFYLRGSEPGSIDQVDLEPLFTRRLLHSCQPDSESETDLYVDYASQLDDGEAMSLAIACSRAYALATDERKARRLFLSTGIDRSRLLSTSDLIRGWAAESIDTQRVIDCLLQIETRARYRPNAEDANYEWWMDLLVGHR